MRTEKEFTISVVGLGYVGLCTAVTFAFRGFKTFGFDIDNRRIEGITKGQPPFYEPQLKTMTRSALKSNMLEVTNDVSQLVAANVSFLTVGTPSKANGSIDLNHVLMATQALGRVLRKKQGYHLVAVKSTIVPGTTTAFVRPCLELSSGKKVGSGLGLCANPEFLKEGTAIKDALHPDKIVIGGIDKRSAFFLNKLYARLHRGNVPPIVVTSPETAELIKYASNAFLATKISFINTIANIAQHIRDTDVNEVARALGYDPRIGPLFLKAGPGYGGSCFHKDLQALLTYSKRNGYDPNLLSAVEEVNDTQADKVVELSIRLLGDLKGKRIAVLGLAFKKNTDDIREAASLRIIDRLRRRGASIVACDPKVSQPMSVFGKTVQVVQDVSTALKGADCAITVTEWDQFGKLKASDYLGLMRTPNLVDARRVYNPSKFVKLNFAAIGLGSVG